MASFSPFSSEKNNCSVPLECEPLAAFSKHQKRQEKSDLTPLGSGSLGSIFLWFLSVFSPLWSQKNISFFNRRKCPHFQSSINPSPFFASFPIFCPFPTPLFPWTAINIPLYSPSSFSPFLLSNFPCIWPVIIFLRHNCLGRKEAIIWWAVQWPFIHCGQWEWTLGGRGMGLINGIKGKGKPTSLCPNWEEARIYGWEGREGRNKGPLPLGGCIWWVGQRKGVEGRQSIFLPFPFFGIFWQPQKCLGAGNN